MGGRMPAKHDSMAPKKRLPGQHWEAADAAEIKKLFLASLRKSPNISKACKSAFDIPRQTVYAWRESDTEFARIWDEILDAAVDELESVAHQRALTESDTLMIFLLKAHRPEKYREQVDHAHKGEVKVTYTQNWRGGVGDADSNT